MAITKSQLEIFVETYLKSLKSHLVRRSDKKYIQKAANMILAATTDSPCCTDNTTVIDLYTPHDNKLTDTIRAFLQKIDKRRWKQSLKRTILLLQRVVFDPCCPLTTLFNLVYSKDPGCSNSSTLFINGDPVGSGFTTTGSDNIYQDMVNGLNATYGIVGTFYLYADNVIAFRLNAQSPEDVITLNVVINCGL